MIVTYVTYVRILDSLVLMSELISFADCDHETRTYTYVSCAFRRDGVS